MKKTLSFFASMVLAAGAICAAAQTSLTQTTLSAAITTSQLTIPVASVVGIVAPTNGGPGSVLFADGEAMSVQSLVGTNVRVIRGQFGTKGKAHVAGAGILIGPPNAFFIYGPNYGEACTPGVGTFTYSPVVASVTGLQWLCSPLTGSVVPGFNNTLFPEGVTSPVASVAGPITPTGPLFHITGTAAISGINIPVGLNPKGGATICAIPDGAFTTTTAGNISAASTAVVGKPLCWTYDGNSGKFNPSY